MVTLDVLLAANPYSLVHNAYSVLGLHRVPLHFYTCVFGIHINEAARLYMLKTSKRDDVYSLTT